MSLHPATMEQAIIVDILNYCRRMEKKGEPVSAEHVREIVKRRMPELKDAIEDHTKLTAWPSTCSTCGEAPTEENPIIHWQPGSIEIKASRHYCRRCSNREQS